MSLIFIANMPNKGTSFIMPIILILNVKSVAITLNPGGEEGGELFNEN